MPAMITKHSRHYFLYENTTFFTKIIIFNYRVIFSLILFLNTSSHNLILNYLSVYLFQQYYQH